MANRGRKRRKKQDTGQEVFKGPTTLPTPDGGEIVLHPLKVGDFQALRDQALAEYRRGKIRVVLDNLDLIDDEAEKSRLRREAFADAHNIDFEDLPDKEVKEYEDEPASLKLPEEERTVKGIHKMEYCGWWVQTLAGVIHLMWLSARRDQSQKSITKERISELFKVNEDSAEIELAASEVMQSSKLSLEGNEEAP